jgi:hypothetical protein
MAYKQIHEKSIIFFSFFSPTKFLSFCLQTQGFFFFFRLFFLEDNATVSPVHKYLDEGVYVCGSPETSQYRKGRWVARLLATAALWVRLQTYLKKMQNGRHKQSSHSSPPKKYVQYYRTPYFFGH